MNDNTLVAAIGFPATLLHGDTLVLDRWNWLKRRLPRTANGESLLDVGCGSGAFTIGASLRGYKALGLSFDHGNNQKAVERANICRAASASFQIFDVRKLDKLSDISLFDVVICLETVEHILDDRKLFHDMSQLLCPGGRLLLTTPNFYYCAITRADNGPFCETETGWHVRRGYTPSMLQELCADSGLVVTEISYCSGFFSQKSTWALRHMNKLDTRFAWLLSVPFRPFIPMLDQISHTFIDWPKYSICLEAYRPRFR